MKVLFVTSECYPLVKTGGLADVTGALPLALGELDVGASVLLPAYAGVRDQLNATTSATAIGELFGGAAKLVSGTTTNGLGVLLVDAPHLYRRTEGGPYLGPKGKDWPDNHLRFAALSWVAAELAAGRLGEFTPDIVHLHDWQAALTAAYMRFDKSKSSPQKPPSLLTIHNLAFQGLFPKSRARSLRLPSVASGPDGFRHWNKISFLKAGVRWCDAITTVSPTYAREIQTAAGGMGFDTALSERGDSVVGITNGIDDHIWNPATDAHIVAHYSATDPSAKHTNRDTLRTELGLHRESEGPLFCVISRLTEQKGLDLLIDALPILLERGAQLALLGTGDAGIEQSYRAAAQQHHGRVTAVIGYDEALSHRMQAGADAIIVPSRFEPCGLTQLIGLRYGTLPIVANVGGLADTVVDASPAALGDGTATGFQFPPDDAQQLAAAITRACDLFATPTAWQRVMQQAMATDVGWTNAAASYKAIYERLLA